MATFKPEVLDAGQHSAKAYPGLSIVHAAWGVYRSDLDELSPANDPEDLGSDSESEGVSEGWDTSSTSDDSYIDRGDVSDDSSFTESEGDMLEGEVAALMTTQS